MSEPKVIVENENVFIHFEGMKIPILQKQRFKIGGSEDLLLKAAGKKNLKKDHPLLIDLTTGLARDAFHFAALGFNVIGIERNSFIFSALVKAKSCSKLDRITFINSEALKYLQSIRISPDVIFYDPMFPEKKKSAEAGKESQLLQALASTDAPEAELEIATKALAIASDRLVVKRPIPAPPLIPKPSMSFIGKAVRYDVYLAKR